MRDELFDRVNKAAEKLMRSSEISGRVPEFNLVIPDNSDHGDYATNIAMQLTRILKKNPKQIAEDLVAELLAGDTMGIKAEVAGPGFINLTLPKSYFQNTLINIITDKSFFDNKILDGNKILLEFVSANPTGPLHIGHGRGAAYGDTLGRILKASGAKVYKEYYINDGGNQMNNLGLSVYARIMEKADKKFEFPENGYRGDYIKTIADEVTNKYPNILEMPEDEAVLKCLDYAIKSISDGIKKDLEDFDVRFDNWFSEKTLYKSGAVERTLGKLKEKGYTYEKDGALWFATEKMGDDKDRVLKKQTGEYTYLAPDIAYHADKYKRGYNRLIDVWGADHHGYIKRMTCAIEALGYEASSFEAQLMQMVNLVGEGEKISMSTRAGSFIELSELIKEVGKDAARFFYNMRSHDAQFDFDISLAKSRSSDNPVYYIQYAHARVHSLLSNAKDKGIEYKRGANLERLISKQELDMIKQMIKLKYIIELAATHLEPHRVCYHLQELASIFHNYYYSNPIVIVEDKELSNARLTLAEAIAASIKKGLDLIGVSAPERM